MQTPLAGGANVEQTDDPAASELQELETLFGPPALLESERKEDYDRLLTSICKTVQPQDIFEQMYCRELADISWDIRRLRAWKTLLCSWLDKKQIYAPPLPADPEVIANPAIEMDRSFLEDPRYTQSRSPLTVNDPFVRNDVDHDLHMLVEFERLVGASEMRRHVCLRELERHRDGLGASLKALQALSNDEEDQVPAEESPLVPKPGENQSQPSMSADAAS